MSTIEWKEWMKEYGVIGHQGGTVWALLDTNAGLIHHASETKKSFDEMLAELRLIADDPTCDEDEYQLIEIQNAILRD